MPKHHSAKTYGGVETKLHVFLTSILLEMSGQLHGEATLFPGNQILVGKPEGRRAVVGPELRGKYNIKMYIKELG
jgi:hypothetical protein